jgi:phage terminase large subunit
MGELRQIRIPYSPRNWARPFHEWLGRFIVLVLHRRAGKTTAVINHHIRAATDDAWEERRLRHLQPGLSASDVKELLRDRFYGHVLPTYKQAELVAWARIAKHYAEVIPGVEFNESKLRITFPRTKHGRSQLQLFGAEDPDSLRGAPFSGLSFDEYSQMAPTIFGEVLSKSLADHLGWVVFCGTIKGKNHLYRNYEAGAADPKWFALWRDVNESLETETGATITMLRQAMADDRDLIAKGLMTQAEYDQEWFLSPEAAIKGAWFGDQMAAAQADGRICRVPYDPALPVDTDWDLGIDDFMSIWFSQSLKSREVRLIDYYEMNGEGFPHYVKALNGALPGSEHRRHYVYGKHHAPRDIAVRELGTGKSRLETAAGLGLKFEDPHSVPHLDLVDGINALRMLLPRCWFDEQKCAHGIEALRNYKKTWNERLQQFTGVPVHDWACVTGDTRVLLRYGTYQIQNLPRTGEVWTACGWKTFENPRVTRRRAQLVGVTFDDGLTVRCTPDHLWLTESGWSFASDLQTGSLIQSSLTRSHSISTAACIDCGQGNGISPAAARSFIEMCGVGLLGLFRTAVTSIIGMATHQTTQSIIWSACRPLSIWPGVGRYAIPGMGAISRLPQGVAQLNGTLPRRVGSGIAEMLSAQRVGRSGSASLARAMAAERSNLCSCGRMATRRSTVPIPARLLRIVTVKPLQECEDVWCLTVPDGHVWSVENGAITHNSHGADSARGLAVRHQPPKDAAKPSTRPALPHRSGLGWMG